MMFEIRIKLPYLSKTNPNIEQMKADLIRSASRGQIPSYCMSDGDTSLVTLVEVPDEPEEVKRE